MRPSRSRSAIQNSHSGRSRRSGSESTASASWGRSSAADRLRDGRAGRARGAGGSAGRGRAGPRCARTGCRSLGGRRAARTWRPNRRACVRSGPRPPGTTRRGPTAARAAWLSLLSQVASAVRAGPAIRPCAAGYSRRSPYQPIFTSVYPKGSDISRERVAGGRVARVEALAEPARPLRGGAVREGLGADAARRLGLDAVVADRARGGQALLEVALLEQPALVGRVRPHAGEAVGLELLADGERVALVRVPADGVVDLIADPRQGLHVVAHLVREHVGLREVARRVEARGQLAEEAEVDVDLAVGGAVERPCLRG